MLPQHQKRLRKASLGSELAKALSRAIAIALDLLLPARCVVCQREGRFLCERCQDTLPRLRRPYCSLCASPGAAQLCAWCAATAPAFDGISAPYLMEGPVREMVYGLKYQNLRASAPELGRLIVVHLESDPIAADVLVPVPLHNRREKERGYNQSVLLAREVSKHTGIPVAARVLRRTRDIPPQASTMTREERRQNMEGAFEASADLGGQRVLLIDDVVTTGSTMSACAAPLKASGAASVWGVERQR